MFPNGTAVSRLDIMEALSQTLHQKLSISRSSRARSASATRKDRCRNDAVKIKSADVAGTKNVSLSCKEGKRTVDFFFFFAGNTRPTVTPLSHTNMHDFAPKTKLYVDAFVC